MAKVKGAKASLLADSLDHWDICVEGLYSYQGKSWSILASNPVAVTIAH